MPAVAYVVVVVGVAPELRSKVPLASRSHSYFAIVPSGSLEPEPLKVTVWPITTGFGVAVKAAVGA